MVAADNIISTASVIIIISSSYGLKRVCRPLYSTKIGSTTDLQAILRGRVRRCVVSVLQVRDIANSRSANQV